MCSPDAGCDRFSVHVHLSEGAMSKRARESPAVSPAKEGDVVSPSTKGDILGVDSEVRVAGVGHRFRRAPPGGEDLCICPWKEEKALRRDIEVRSQARRARTCIMMQT